MKIASKTIDDRDSHTICPLFRLWLKGFDPTTGRRRGYHSRRSYHIGPNLTQGNLWLGRQQGDAANLITFAVELGLNAHVRTLAQEM
jgi:hypothetical protein